MKAILYAGLAALVLTTPLFGQSASGSGNAYQTSTLGIIGEPLLQSFDFAYRIGDDHHVRTVGVIPNNHRGSVQVGFFDRNFDDQYRWSVWLLGASRATASVVASREAALASAHRVFMFLEATSSF